MQLGEWMEPVNSGGQIGSHSNEGEEVEEEVVEVEEEEVGADEESWEIDGDICSSKSSNSSSSIAVGSCNNIRRRGGRCCIDVVVVARIVSLSRLKSYWRRWKAKIMVSMSLFGQCRCRLRARADTPARVDTVGGVRRQMLVK